MAYSPNSDWKTSKGNVAPDIHWSGADDAAAAYPQLKADIEQKYAGAVVIGTSTRTYNCHAFVHASSHAWFNDIAQFLKDDYYPYTPGTLQINDAVVYVKDGQITHSGFIIQLSGNTIVKLRSKWGASCLVEHPPSSVPPIYGSIVYYLRKRPAMTVAGVNMPSDATGYDPSALIAAMLSEERVRELWLASTPQVAEMIVKSWPEFAMLQLLGTSASDVIKQKLAEADDDRRFVLATIAKHSGDAALEALVRDRH